LKVNDVSEEHVELISRVKEYAEYSCVIYYTYKETELSMTAVATTAEPLSFAVDPYQTLTTDIVFLMKLAGGNGPHLYSGGIRFDYRLRH
jgi:hypothetical protein